MTGSLYDDGKLALDEMGLTIRHYYFPWAGSKRVDYSEVVDVECRTIGWFTGRGSIWGSAHPHYWLPLDLSRPRRTTMVVLDLGRRVRPALTPDDPHHVAALIKTRLS